MSEELRKRIREVAAEAGVRDRTTMLDATTVIVPCNPTVKMLIEGAPRTRCLVGRHAARGKRGQLMAEINIRVSATEFPQFRRLVEFVTEITVHADATDDDELRGLVKGCRADLLEMTIGRSETYTRHRADGWPLCPRCGDDELWSPELEPTVDTIVSCLGCGWRPA